MAKCKKVSRKVSNAGRDLSSANSKRKKSQAGKILKEHQDEKH